MRTFDTVKGLVWVGSMVVFPPSRGARTRCVSHADTMHGQV